MIPKQWHLQHILGSKKFMILKIFIFIYPLYLLINHASGYIEEENRNKYLIFDFKDENKELLEKYNDVYNGIMDKIKEISSGECDYEKDYIKI